MGRYYADVAYNYEVDRRSYTGSRIRASDGEFDIRDGAVQAMRGLREGQQVMVYYNPADAAQSVLCAGAGLQEYALRALPVVMFTMGAVAFWHPWQTRSMVR